MSIKVEEAIPMVIAAGGAMVALWFFVRALRAFAKWLRKRTPLQWFGFSIFVTVVAIVIGGSL